MGGILFFWFNVYKDDSLLSAVFHQIFAPNLHNEASVSDCMLIDLEIDSLRASPRGCGPIRMGLFHFLVTGCTFGFKTI